MLHLLSLEVHSFSHQEFAHQDHLCGSPDESTRFPILHIFVSLAAAENVHIATWTLLSKYPSAWLRSNDEQRATLGTTSGRRGGSLVFSSSTDLSRSEYQKTFLLSSPGLLFVTISQGLVILITPSPLFRSRLYRQVPMFSRSWLVLCGLDLSARRLGIHMIEDLGWAFV